jgi:hypothetical protein
MNKSDQPFYCTFKIVTGEEILAEVSSEHQNDEDFFIVVNPIVIHEMTTIDHEKRVLATGLAPKKWLQYSSGDDMTIIYKNHVVSMTELDKFGVEFYNKALIAAKMASPIKRRIETRTNSGFVGKIDNARNRLEKIFRKSPSVKDPE